MMRDSQHQVPARQELPNLSLPHILAASLRPGLIIHALRRLGFLPIVASRCDVTPPRLEGDQRLGGSLRSLAVIARLQGTWRPPDHIKSFMRKSQEVRGQGKFLDFRGLARYM